MFRWILFIAIILAKSLCVATNLIKIDSKKIDDKSYKISFHLDGYSRSEIFMLENQQKIALDLTNVNFNIEASKKRLMDSHFVHRVTKIKLHGNILRLIIELNPNAKLAKHYYVDSNASREIVLAIENNISSNDEKRTYSIAIDPGHGGKDLGTVNPLVNIPEKDITLSYAIALQKELSKYPQYKIFLIRETDIYLNKETRLEKISKIKADILISLHANFNKNPNISGASLYIISKEAIKKETDNIYGNKDKRNIIKNDKLLLENEHIADVLVNMMYKNTLKNSACLADKTKISLANKVKMLPNSSRSGNFRVLKGIDTSAIIVELGHLSNLNEAKMLISYNHQQKLIHALAQGINQYFIQCQ